MKAAYDCGVNFFDCAENYSDGQAEVAMGLAIKKYGWKRNDLVISTKVRDSQPQDSAPPLPTLTLTSQIYWGTAHGNRPINNKGLSRKHVIEGMDGALERLGLKYVDLIYAHRPDRHTPMDEIVRAFNHLIDTGRALYWGTSEWSADEIAQAWRVADKLNLVGPLMEQPAYNMLDRERVEREYSHLYRDVGLGLTVYSPLHRGILSGKYKHGIPEGSRFSMNSISSVSKFWAKTDKEKWNALMDQVSRLEPIADSLGCRLSQLALAWVIRNKNVTCAIMGASSKEQVYENIRAIDIASRMTDEMMAEIDDIFGNKPEEHPMRP
jgi:voltage-dependent potassium channel beta subunit